MKKILIGGAIILLLVGAFAPFVNGLLMEKIVRQSYGDVNTLYADSGSDVSVEIIRYDRGFSSSEIEWKLKLGSMQSLYGVDEVVFLDRAKHKMLGIVTETSLEKNQWFTDLVEKKLDGNNPLHIATEYRLSGTLSSTIGLDAFSFTIEEGVVEVEPAKMNISANSGLTELKAKGTWQGMNAADQLLVEAVTIDSDLEKISTFIWDGTMTYRLAHAQISEKKAQNENVEVSGMQGEYELDYDREKNTLSVAGKFTADELTGKHERISNASVSIALDNLDGEGYEEYMRVYTGLANTILKSVSAADQDPEAMEQAVKQQAGMAGIQMMAAGEKLLKKGLEFRVEELSAELASGNITGSLMFRLNQDLTFMQLAPLASQPNLAFQLFDLKSALTIPATLVDEPAQLVTPMLPGMQTGFFEVRGDQLIHQAETKDGKLFLNGQEVLLN